ncbi:ABC transporter permease [Phytohalomonas tamaricis]|uniref:ABC transporter permease n=1 Tax=Phytohalomonas tamaricis TaxID=2081032 RepID=UPI0021D3F227|nr:ABC transporter permease [Phytohalomonas tamaricis]
MSQDNISELSQEAALPPSEKVVQWALAAMAQQQWALAAERWAVLRQAYPELPAVWIQAGACCRHLEQWETSQFFLETAVERFPDNPYALLELATLEQARDRPVRAGQLLELARQRFPNQLPVLLKSADHALDQSDDTVALAYNSEARKKYSADVTPWVQYANIAMRQQQWSVALERWSEVRQRFPQHPAGYNRAAEAASQLGDDRKARQLLLAREYGQEWLESFEKPEEDLQILDNKISPPTRRHWLAFIDLVWTKARLNLKSEANQNHLRYLWWIIDPMLYMAVFYLVFGLLLHRGGGGDFIVFLLTGLVPFQWFAKTVQQSSNSIVAGQGLMHQVRISPLFFPLVGVLQNTGKQLPVFALLLGFLTLYGLPPNIYWLAFIPIVLLQFFLMAIASCFVAMLVPFVRDLSNLIPTGIQFILFCSGVFYSPDTIPEQWHSLFFANPMANILYQYRRVLMDHQWPDWSGMGWVLLGCLLAGVLLLWFYKRVEGILPRVVV